MGNSGTLQDQMTRTKMKMSLVVATMKAVTSRIRLKMKRVTQGQVVVTKRKVVIAAIAVQVVIQEIVGVVVLGQVVVTKVVIAAVAVQVVIQEIVEVAETQGQMVVTRKVGQCVFCLQS